jgi:murein DD-endopeptidase MepM/ murein hydrolase activator NlpD
LTRRMDLLSSSLTEAIDSMAIREEVFLATPSINPVVGESWLSSGFSRSRYHPILHVNRPHLGLDISAARGAPVIATANGRVTYAGNRLGYGKVVEIDHGHGYKTRFAHVQNITVRRGQQVRRGSVVGEVGQTGLATGPNVHYEVVSNDRRVNPANYILFDGGSL